MTEQKDEYQIFVVGPPSRDRNRIMKVLQLLREDHEWDDERQPPNITDIEAVSDLSDK